MPLLIDQCKRKVSLPEKPARIISLVPSQTELLFDLGLEKEVVGITKFCVHPSHWRRDKSIVGGTKSLHIDKIVALSPDLIIANKEENNQEDIEILSKHAAVWVSDVKNLADSLQMIEDLGRICNRLEKARPIKDAIKSNFASLRKLKRPLGCLYFIWQNPFMFAGSNTFIDDMLQNCGFHNLAADSAGRYPQLNEWEIERLQADVLLLSSEPFPFKQKHVEAMKKKFTSSRIMLVDGELFSWYGSRLKQSVNYFNQLVEEIEKSI